MPPLIVGHRGAKDVLPENTLVSFRRAIADGADVLECDVHLSGDGRLVVMHDARIDRTVSEDSPRRSGAIAELTAADLADVRVGGGREGTDQPVPYLEEVLDLAADAQVPLLLEVKAPTAAEPVARLLLARAGDGAGAAVRSSPVEGSASSDEDALLTDVESPGLAPGVHALVEPSGRDRVVVISFLREVLETLREVAPRQAIGLITKTPTEDDWQYATRIGARTFGLTLTNLREHDVVRAQEAGMALNAWTLNDPDAVVFAAEIGVDTLTTDDPAWARAVLDATALEQSALAR
ncbi:glycerophosphodiester phosphodiesterase [Brachybacterium sp. MASK1Z-5]|uniref:Glycerophosphodiester phosphodiesterase n=1 Tax=Brachybacterium halotolerans TaxID=2795215 RepID=A0ABS1B9Z7_9MICO|nr:glycerophosphodiester phosphodiesterase family protein [Brachybacterium halotolerans]MBK0331439.1 glycerophosphodiester phosphodiesterase [Brachybacterium halotolerans]